MSIKLNMILLHYLIRSVCNRWHRILEMKVPNIWKGLLLTWEETTCGSWKVSVLFWPSLNGNTLGLEISRSSESFVYNYFRIPLALKFFDAFISWSFLIKGEHLQSYLKAIPAKYVPTSMGRELNFLTSMISKKIKSNYLFIIIRTIALWPGKHWVILRKSK